MSVLQKVTRNSEFFRYELVTYTHRTERVHWKNKRGREMSWSWCLWRRKGRNLRFWFYPILVRRQRRRNFMVWFQSWSFHTYLSMSVGLFYYCWDSIWRHRNHFTELTDLETYSCVSRKVLLFYHVYIQYQCALWDTSAKCSDVIGQMCSCSNYNKNNNMIYCANTCVIDISGHTAQH